MAQKAQINRCDGLEQIHPAGAVPQAVMGLQGDPPVIVIDADQVTAVSLKGHGHAEIAHVRLHEGPGPFVGLQIAPEKPPAHGYFIGGEALQSQVRSPLQDVGPDGFLQQDRKAVDGGKVPALQRRIDDGGEIQPVPGSGRRFFSNGHGVSSSFSSLY